MLLLHGSTLEQNQRSDGHTLKEELKELKQAEHELQSAEHKLK